MNTHLHWQAFGNLETEIFGAALGREDIKFLFIARCADATQIPEINAAYIRHFGNTGSANICCWQNKLTIAIPAFALCLYTHNSFKHTRTHTHKCSRLLSVSCNQQQTSETPA